MATLRVRGGVLAPNAAVAGDGLGGRVVVERKEAFRFEATRGTAPAVAIADVAPDDVLRLELEGGLELIVRGDRVAEVLPEAASRKGGVLEVDSTLAGTAATRGFGTLLVRALEIFGVDVLGAAATEIARAFEQKILKPAGLRTLRLGGRFQLATAVTQPQAADRPLLVFVHGTGSNTEAGFGSLWQAANEQALATLAPLYDGVAFAFEHRSMSESPVANALQLAESLPDGARVHLVTHSRGGLVGELLCRGQRSDGRKPFEREELDACYAANGDERRELVELGRLLERKRIRVERFVRVACPGRGTTLASKRLDRWLSVAGSLMKRLPHLRGVPLLADFFDLTLALVAQKAEPETLPGLAAMMPDAPLIRLLNHPQAAVGADLTVIAGDSGGSTLWSRLKLLVPDLFYGGDHDLVVNTTSMYGGTQRAEGGARFLLDEGAEVDHFRYFTNRRTVDALVEGLSRLDSAAGGFQPIERARRDEAVPTRATRGAPGSRPVVFVVPGICGTHITVDGTRVWVEPFELAFGRGIGAIAMNAPGEIAPEALVGRAYDRLVRFLADTHDVETFPFDWRRSLLVEAGRFADALAKALEAAARSRQPVRIVAHSMGGLLTRAALALRPELQRSMAGITGSRIVMLGTPNGGSWSIPRLLLGHERLLRALAVTDIRLKNRDILRIVADFPGVLEMLPTAVRGGHDFFDLATWNELARVEVRNGELGWVIPDADRLRDARALRAQIDAVPIDPDLTRYLAGWAEKTPSGIEIDDEERKVGFLATALGDGRVLWDTGIPRNVRTWYSRTVHGDLSSDASIFPALLDLLRTGRTDRLSTSPPALARGIADAPPVALEPDEVSMLPDADALADAALGGGAAGGTRDAAARRERRTSRQIRVSVTHGDLAYARHVVAVGHYADDTIVGAEDALDRRLGNRMRRRRDLGLYPGELGTSQVFLSSDARPGGALVLGLGRVGELTPRRLRSGFSRAVLDFALALLEDERFRPAHSSHISAMLSPLLIGTGAGGITVRQAVLAMLRGTRDANAQLRLSRLDTSISIDAIEFVELWEDVALEAARVLASCGEEDLALQGEIVCDPQIRSGKAGLVRTRFEEAAGWWDRLRIVTDTKGAGALRFFAITGRARNEVTLVATQRTLLDHYLAQATGSIAQSRDLARSLFERLLPLRLKDGSLEQRDLVFVLDEQSSRYPWELLEDGWSGDEKPLAVRGGLIRQLETESFRPAVVSTPDDRALVVGDPETQFQPLPGAAEEARIVADRLRADAFVVEQRIHADATSICTALDARSYRVLHLAGHGVHDHELAASEKLACERCGHALAARPERISGFALSGGAFLTPGDVEQMRQVPELVFLNCCYLGSMTTGSVAAPSVQLHQLAANLAGQFIRMGARAVVAAGWEVQDEAAQLFARVFYDAMLEGEKFGRAVHRARVAVYDTHPELNTWGAYQCYGDPDYVLVRQPRVRRGDGRRSYASPREAVVELANLAARAQAARGEDLAEIRKALDEALAQTRRANEKWLARADVLAAAGTAEAALGDFGAAIDRLDRAVALEDGTVTVRQLEQLANFKSRYAVEVAASDPQRAHRLCKESLQELARIRKLGDTVERLNLLGSAQKRAAWIRAGAERDAALVAMVKAYGNAYDRAKETGRDVTYPLQNWLCGRVVSRWLGRADATLEQDAEASLPAAQQAARLAERSDPDIWTGIALTELRLTQQLIALSAAPPAAAATDSFWDSIAQLYEGAFARGASPRERRSVTEQLHFLETMALAAGRDALAVALRGLRERITV